MDAGNTDHGSDVEGKDGLAGTARSSSQHVVLIKGCQGQQHEEEAHWQHRRRRHREESRRAGEEDAESDAQPAGDPPSCAHPVREVREVEQHSAPGCGPIHRI